MIYTLHSAVDMRDQKPMLWITRQLRHGIVFEQVALFAEKTHPAYIKRLNLVSPESVTWEGAHAFNCHADVSTIKLIDQWEAPE